MADMDRLMLDLRLLDELLADLGGPVDREPVPVPVADEPECTQKVVPPTSTGASTIASVATTPPPIAPKKAGGARMHAVNGVPHPESHKGRILLYLLERPEGARRSEILRELTVNSQSIVDLKSYLEPKEHEFSPAKLNVDGRILAAKVKAIRSNLQATPTH